jgi:quinol monooxygenase YgiN
VNSNKERPRVTAGLDLGDKYSYLCLLDIDRGEAIEEGRLITTPEAFRRRFASETTFTQWSLDNVPGAQSYVLLRDSADPRRFVTFGAFESQEAVSRWREKPEFTQLRDACIELCEEFEPHDYTVAASPSR